MDSRFLSDRSQIFAHAEPYMVSGFVNQYVGHHALRVPFVGSPRAKLNHRKFACLDLCRVSYGARARVTSPALKSSYHLQLLLSGECLWKSYRQEQYLVPGELLLINPDDPVDLTYSEDCEKLIIKIPIALISAVCTEHRWPLPSGGVRFVQNRYRLMDLEGFESLLSIICQEAESNTSFASIQEHYVQIIAYKILMQMRTNLRRDVGCSREASFELLANYIEENICKAISKEELAAHANLSLRSLYVLFERNAKTTPKNYIRQKRLERIRVCLRDPTCQVRSITELAMDYGFLHLGRFAESYRQAFGERPSETLRNRASLR